MESGKVVLDGGYIDLDPAKLPSITTSAPTSSVRGYSPLTNYRVHLYEALNEGSILTTYVRMYVSVTIRNVVNWHARAQLGQPRRRRCIDLAQGPLSLHVIMLARLSLLFLAILCIWKEDLPVHVQYSCHSIIFYIHTV